MQNAPPSPKALLNGVLPPSPSTPPTRPAPRKSLRAAIPQVLCCRSTNVNLNFVVDCAQDPSALVPWSAQPAAAAPAKTASSPDVAKQAAVQGLMSIHEVTLKTGKLGIQYQGREVRLGARYYLRTFRSAVPTQWSLRAEPMLLLRPFALSCAHPRRLPADRARRGKLAGRTSRNSQGLVGARGRGCLCLAFIASMLLAHMQPVQSASALLQADTQH